MNGVRNLDEQPNTCETVDKLAKNREANTQGGICWARSGIWRSFESWHTIREIDEIENPTPGKEESSVEPAPIAMPSPTAPKQESNWLLSAGILAGVIVGGATAVYLGRGPLLSLAQGLRKVLPAAVRDISSGIRSLADSIRVSRALAAEAQMEAEKLAPLLRIHQDLLRFEEYRRLSDDVKMEKLSILAEGNFDLDIDGIKIEPNQPEKRLYIFSLGESVIITQGELAKDNAKEIVREKLGEISWYKRLDDNVRQDVVAKIITGDLRLDVKGVNCVVEKPKPNSITITSENGSVPAPVKIDLNKGVDAQYVSLVGKAYRAVRQNLRINPDLLRNAASMGIDTPSLARRVLFFEYDKIIGRGGELNAGYFKANGTIKFIEQQGTNSFATVPDPLNVFIGADFRNSIFSGQPDRLTIPGILSGTDVHMDDSMIDSRAGGMEQVAALSAGLDAQSAAEAKSGSPSIGYLDQAGLPDDQRPTLIPDQPRTGGARTLLTSQTQEREALWQQFMNSKAVQEALAVVPQLRVSLFSPSLKTEIINALMDMKNDPGLSALHMDGDAFKPTAFEHVMTIASSGPPSMRQAQRGTPGRTKADERRDTPRADSDTVEPGTEKNRGAADTVKKGGR
ncbi:MAG: hypothetical protein ABH871_00260 [Pseudomonadota bacterium]